VGSNVLERGLIERAIDKRLDVIGRGTIHLRWLSCFRHTSAVRGNAWDKRGEIGDQRNGQFEQFRQRLMGAPGVPLLFPVPKTFWLPSFRGVLTDWLIREFSDGVGAHRDSDFRLLAAPVSSFQRSADPGLISS
jgi:hypothetical protein